MLKKQHNERSCTNNLNSKSFVHLFKGGGVEGWSPSSPSAEGEIPFYPFKTEQGVRNAKAFRGEAYKTASPLNGTDLLYLQNVPVERFGQSSHKLFIELAQSKYFLTD